METNRKRKILIITGISVAAVLTVSIVLAIIIHAVTRKDGISADKWHLRALNRHIDGYVDDIGPIETADDLYAALLDGGIDLKTDLAPNSVKWGYHYWYDVNKQKLVLATYGELAAESDGSASRSTAFEPDSPRSLVDGYYLMDMPGETENKIASFIESLKTLANADEYRAALDAVKFSAFSEDRSLGALLLRKMNATALVNANGIFTNTDDPGQILHIYIPENLSGEEYIITGRLHGAADLSKVNTDRITLPLNITVCEFTFLPFGEGVTLHVNANSAEELAKIISADCASGPISIRTGEVFTVDKKTLKDSSDAPVQTEQDGKLTELSLVYRRPVTDFEISSEQALSKGEGAVYIDRTEIGRERPNGTLYAAYSIPSFTLTAESFNENVSSEEVVWEEVEDENQLISVDRHTGKVTLERIPAVGNRENYTATVKATAKAGGRSETVEIYIVRPIAITLNFGASVMEISDGETKSATFDYTKSDRVKSFTVQNIRYNRASMVVCDVGTSYSCETPNDADFKLTADGSVEIPSAPGAILLKRTVAVKVGCLEAMCEISVQDMSDTPIEVKLKNGNYIYRVGNKNPIRLGHLFQTIEGASVDPDEIMIDVRSIDGISILDNPTFGVITMPQEQIINAERWEDTALQFTGTGFCTVEIRTSRTGTARITLEIVDGTNVTEWVTGKATDNLVFQSDVTVPSQNYMLSLGKYTIYGNGFVIDASSVTKNNPVDDPSTKKDENSTTEDLISISGGGLDGVILRGGTFGEVQYGSDEKNPYWFHGVNVRQDVTIRNCYIYGFRTPVRAEGGTLNISDTVLDGGCLANIYVSRATNVNLHNVTTIQDEYASGTIGCGLLFANGGTSVLTVTGEFTQYNYATKKQMTKLGGAEYGMVISGKLSRLTQFKHGNYYHTGILILGRGTKSGGSIDYSNMPKLQHNLAALGYTSDTVSNEIVVYIKAQLISIDNSKCGDCSPRLKPSDLTGDGKYNHIDFISRLGDITSSSN